MGDRRAWLWDGLRAQGGGPPLAAAPRQGWPRDVDVGVTAGRMEAAPSHNEMSGCDC